MKKNILALSIACMVGGLGFAGAASAGPVFIPVRPVIVRPVIPPPRPAAPAKAPVPKAKLPDAKPALPAPVYIPPPVLRKKKEEK